jgi:threonine dehydrogenase-like Zn-dependent dehydrogenase
VLTDWWQLAVHDVPDPVPAPGDVVLDVLATGICGSDIHGFTGATGRRQPGQVMGHETVGRIRSVGAEVSAELGLRVGGLATVNPVIACGVCAACRTGRDQRCTDRRIIGVDPTISSAFAEQLVAPAGNVIALPDDLPAELGALVEPLAVGYHAARRGGVADGDAVLVIGGGPIGQSCVLAARRLGAVGVAVSEPDEHRRELCRAIGAVPVHAAAEDLATEVSAALGRSPDVVIDAVGISATVASALACTPAGGTVVLVGMGAPELAVPAYAVSTQERSVVGSFGYSASEFADTAAWVADAPAELATLIEGRVELDAAQDSFTALARGQSAASKIIVFPNGAAALRATS